MCVLFKTNLDVELKLLHIICLCMSSFSIYQKNKNQKETPPSNNLEVRYKPKTTRYTFHIPQKGSKKQSIDIKKELNTAFLHIAIENLEKALTICTYGMAFSSTEKLEEKCFFFKIIQSAEGTIKSLEKKSTHGLFRERHSQQCYCFMG